jgi:hypothetical protein
MWRSRARMRLGVGAVVVALAWPVVLTWTAVPAAAGTTALTVSSAPVQAGQETTLTFNFTAPTPPPAPYLTVTLPMPPGWTAVPPSSSDLACQDSGCELVNASSEQVSVAMRLDLTTTFTLYVQATPPESAAPASFTATGQFRDLATPLEATAPPVTVTCPADGLGTMTVNTLAVRENTATTLTFTYTAGSCAPGPGGTVGVTVPSGWTPPGTVMVPAGNLAPGTQVSFSYGPAQASSAGPATFQAWQSGASGPQQELTSSPVVSVSSAGAPSTPASSLSPHSTPSSTPHAGSAGTVTVTPSRVTASRPSTLRFTYTAAAAGLSPSGEVTVDVPAGWTAPSPGREQAGYVSASRGQLTASGRLITVTGVTLRPGQQLTITYTAGTAPGEAGVSTFITSQRPDGRATLTALTTSPVVTVAPATVAHPAPAGLLPILLAVIGLVLVAGTAGLLAFRPLRRAGHGMAGGNVRAVPHTGPPPSVYVRDTGHRPTLTVRIEPHATATVTTIEEERP